MPEPLKNLYSRDFVAEMCPVLKEVVPGFSQQVFLRRVFDKDWEARELKQRMKHLAAVLRGFLPEDYAGVVKALKAIAKTVRRNGVAEGSFLYMFLAEVIEAYGVDHLDLSIRAMEEVTKLASCEYCIRPFLVKYPEQMIQQMLLWTQHKHPHVRRLASEGSRPRLPWGAGVPALKKDPTPILPILEALRDDTSEMVRRSVANNLNDIAKDHPDVVIGVVRKWSKGATPETTWIIRHACRSLLKRANPDALRLFGLDDSAAVLKFASIHHLKVTPAEVRIGASASFSFRLQVEGEKPVKLRIEYAIDYVKASGQISRKVFRLAEKSFPPGTIEFKRTHSFRQMTTRRHHPGRHTLAILINGQQAALIEFPLK